MDLILLLAAAAVAVALLPAGWPLRLGGLGLCLLALAVAAFQADATRPGAADLAARATTAAIDTRFLQINLGVALGGLGLIAVGGVLAWRAGAQVATAVIALVMAGAGWVVRPIAGPAGVLWPSVVAMATAVAVLLAIGAIGATRIADAIERLDRRWLAPARQFTGHPASRGWYAVGGLGFALLLVPTLWGVCLGAVMLALASHVLARRAGLVGWLPLLPMLVLALVPFWWLATTIAGPTGQSLGALVEGPFSPAAQTLLAVPLLIAALPFFGLFPFHGATPATALAFAGGWLLNRLGPIVPDGLTHWAGLVVPVALVALWHGASAARFDRVAAALGLMGLAVAPTASPPLVLAALSPLLAPAALWRSSMPAWVQRVMLAPVALVALAVFAPLLGAETVYGVLAMAGVMAAIARTRAL